jgi:hypothetical protein
VCDGGAASVTAHRLRPLAGLVVCTSGRAASLQCEQTHEHACVHNIAHGSALTPPPDTSNLPARIIAHTWPLFAFGPVTPLMVAKLASAHIPRWSASRPWRWSRLPSGVSAAARGRPFVSARDSVGASYIRSFRATSHVRTRARLMHVSAAGISTAARAVVAQNAGALGMRPGHSAQHPKDAACRPNTRPNTTGAGLGLQEPSTLRCFSAQKLRTWSAS